MMGGYWFESLFGTNPTEDELLAAAVEEVIGKILIVDTFILALGFFEVGQFAVRKKKT